MRYLPVIILILVGITIQSCNKEEEIQLTSQLWELVSVEEDGELRFKPKKDFFRENAYVLIFNSATDFSMNTGVNYAGGKYSLTKHSDINISSYHEFTEVATSDIAEQELNEKLIRLLPDVSRYEIDKHKLILHANDGTLLFEIL